MNLSTEETVLELQEALQVMERDMSTERTVEAHGKVDQNDLIF